MSRPPGDGTATEAEASRTARRQRHALLALLALFLLTLAVRLLGVYPPTLRHDPAHIALQACRILEGARPIFWSGQAWMGAAGTYVEAALFALFGKSTLVMSLYAWLLSGVWIGLSLLLAWRFFGPRAALISAAIWVVPTSTMLYWSSQARNDFQALFIATPAILLLAQAIVVRHRAGRGIGWQSALFGFLCGFSFWQNMAIGPCLVATFVVLLAHLRTAFWKRFLPLYAPAWLLGFAPVIVYNARNGFPILGQSSGLSDPATVAAAGAALLTNALPNFWGLKIVGSQLSPGNLLQVLFLLWTGLMLGLYVAMVRRTWRRGQDTLAHQLVLGSLVFQILVLLLTGYGKSFTTPGNPSLFFTNLFGLALAIPAVVIAAAGALPRWALALPLAIYAGNNLQDAVGPAAREFLSALSEKGHEAVLHFPDPRNEAVAFLAGQGLEHGYFDDSFGSTALNLAGLGRVESARPFADRVVDYALRSDAAREIFWVKDRSLSPRAFAMIGAAYRKRRLGRNIVYYDFRREERRETLIDTFVVTASHAPGAAGLMTDRRSGTAWSLPSPLPAAWIGFDFGSPEAASTITLLPGDSGALPGRLSAQVSADGVAWKEVASWRKVGPFFWSVRHPFLKLVKPRCELALPRPESARFLRLSIPEQRGRCSIREVYVSRAEAAAEPALSLDREIAAIEAALAPLKKTHLIAGDHYFMSYFKLRGFAVEFLPNRAIDNSGRRNPFLTADLPVDFSRPVCIIAPLSQGGSVGRTLDAAGLANRRTVFPRHEIFVTEPTAAAPELYWSGIDLLRADAVRRGRR